MTLGEADAGRTVDVSAGQEILIRLPANRTTGYSWALVSPDAGKLGRPTGSVYTPDSTAAGMAGAGGIESWTFKANQSGEEELRFEYRRPFELDTPPAKTVSFTIRVR
jgi:inhibitor of cysteine peptidase